MPLTSVARFLEIKKLLRRYPEWTDEQLIERLDLRGPEELGLIAVARRDLEAG